MFLGFFAALREAGVPVSLREHLTLLDAMAEGLVTHDIDGFYHLARASLVKDERHIDRFDRAFASHFGGLEAVTAEELVEALDLPRDWLEKLAEKLLTEAEKAEIAALGGFDTLMETLKRRLAEQQARHQGGSKWIGTAGTSPFGAHGYNPEGVRIGQDESRHRRAVKVWDRREFRDLDGEGEIGTRAIKIALKRLRRWARDGASEELDLQATLRATAEQGFLDLRTRPERRNAVKVVMFFDVGGSMDDHVQGVEDLFSAARSAFKSLDYFYFHNCLYDRVWKSGQRRWSDWVPTTEVLNTYGPQTRVIFVGDASMSPYEIAVPGGGNEYWNAEAGHVWLARVRDRWPASLWINPVPRARWHDTRSIAMVSEIFGPERMVPLTLDGLDRAMRLLAR